MNVELKIILSALAVVIVALVLMVCRATAAREAAWRDMIRRRAEDAEREAWLKPYPAATDVYSTKTLPVIEEGK